jgi:hypothetical protein
MYELIYITVSADVISKSSDTAMPPSTMCIRRPKGTRYFGRYFPKLKVWRIYDAKDFRIVTLPNKRQQLLNTPRPKFVCEGREEAVMAAILSCNNV